MKNGKSPGEKRKIPGPKSEKLLSKREKYVPEAVFNVVPIFVSEASGATITDVDGNEYIDFAGGIGCINMGHSRDPVLNTVKDQADKYLHMCFHVTMYEPYVELAEKLAEITPGDFPKETVLVNSGAEAVENAVKVSRKYTGKPGIVSFEHAFHGRTNLTLSLTSEIDPYKRGFGPFASEVHRIPFAYCYRCPYDLTYPDCGIRCADRLEETFKTYKPAEEIACLIMEPVLGEGGFVVPPEEFVQRIAETCRKHDILYIDDEIQAGIGRAGKMWAIEHFNITPDIITTAKSMGGGLPISAAVGKKEIMDSVHTGGLGGTYGGNPVSCRSALKALEIIEKENLTKRATEIGKTVKDRMEEVKEDCEIIGDVRGLGGMIGIEIVKDPETKEPAEEKTAKILEKSHERGVILIKAGTHGNVIRFLAPLVIDEEDLETGLDVIEDSIRSVSH